MKDLLIQGGITAACVIGVALFAATFQGRQSVVGAAVAGAARTLSVLSSGCGR